MLLGGQPAQARTFTPVGETKGLEARVVPAVMLDSKGFLWVGSREGLFRYDGYQAQAFLPERGNVDAISDIDIRSVYEAADGCILPIPGPSSARSARSYSAAWSPGGMNFRRAVAMPMASGASPIPYRWPSFRPFG